MLKLKSSLVLFASLGLATPALAREPAPARAECVQIAGDAYDPGQPMVKGKYEGECLDTTRKRAVVIIAQDERMYRIANFRHLNRWWIAEIPRGAVKDVIYQMRKFDSGIPFVVAAHSQLRFILHPDQPIRLTTQNDAEGPSESVTLTDLTATVEYIAPRGIQYGVVAGQMEEFAQVPRVTSTRDIMFEKLGDPRIIMDQLRLKNIPGLGDAILEHVLETSDAYGLTHVYKTMSLNCTTEAFDRIDEGLAQVTGARPKKFEMSWLHLLDAVVAPSVKALQARGLIDASSVLPDLRDEARANGTLPTEFLTSNVTELENHR